MSVSVSSRLSSATRCCPLTALPAELSLEVSMLIELEIESLTNLLLVDRLFYSFFKTHEAVLVKNVARRRDPLAALLVLQSNPSFRAFFRLYSEQEIFHSIVNQMQRLDELQHCFPGIKDSNFWRSPGAMYILRAGFLVHHQIVSTKTCQDKYICTDKLPHQTWALCGIFAQFLDSVLDTSCHQVFPEIENLGFLSIPLIHFFILEVAIFSGLRVIKDIVDMCHQPLRMQKMEDVHIWARAFESRYLPHAQTVLLMPPSLPHNELELSSHLYSDLVQYPASIIVGAETIKGFRMKYLYDDILTLAGILPLCEYETALFDALDKIEPEDRRYRITSLDELVKSAKAERSSGTVKADNQGDRASGSKQQI